jgi:hypothetical protein
MKISQNNQNIFGLKILFRMACLLPCFILLLFPTAHAIANPTTYDFSSLGTISGDFRPQGDKFLVSMTFHNDESSSYMYLFYHDTTIPIPVIIKADNTNLAAFDLNNMGFSFYSGATNSTDTITSMTITGTFRAGGTVSQTISNQALTTGSTYSLTGWGADLSAFKDVTQLSFEITMEKDVANLTFETITIDKPISPSKLGDLNSDGVVNDLDALKALRFAAGIDTPTSSDKARGDVAPLVNGLPGSDGTIDIGDVVVILRRAAGLSSW